MSAPLIRPHDADDDPAIVAIHDAQEPGSAPLNIEELHAETGDGDEWWVSVRDGRVTGYARLSYAWWTSRRDVYAVEIRVAREEWGQGVGSRLHDTLLARLTTLNAARLLAWIRADVPESRRFADRHGFRDTGQVIEECSLFIPEAQDTAYTDLEERLGGEGIRVVRLSELAADETLLRALQRLWDGGEDPGMPFETWRAAVLRGAGLSAETHWVALVGRQPVGTTFLKRVSADAAENDYTAVVPSYRGRGIAQLLKIHAIRWARENGMQRFYTSSEIGNTPMITINQRLGYRPGVRKHEVAREL